MRGTRMRAGGPASGLAAAGALVICGAVAVCALVYRLPFVRNAEAHALLLRSVPESGALLQRAPEAITLTFTEQPEPALSAVHVLDSGGRSVERGPAESVPGEPLALRIPLAPLPPAIYTLTWRTVSRIDGHVAGGTFAFGVGIAPSTMPSPRVTNPPPSPLYVISRLFLYLGLSGLLSGVVVEILALRRPPVGAPAYLGGFWAAAAAGLVLLGIAQAGDAGIGIGRLLRTPLGYTLWWRALLIAAAGVAVAIGDRSPRCRRSAFMALSVLTAAAMLAHVIAGHAGAGSGLSRWLNILIQWVHFAGIGAWAGALITLLAIVWSAPPNASTVRQVSMSGAIALGAVAVTGVLRAADEIGSWPALLSTAFGQLVLLKAAFFILLALLGAVGRHLAIAHGPEIPRRLRRVVGIELVTATGALAVTAVLTGLALPSAIPGAAAPGFSVAGNDYATSVRVRLTVTPGVPGVNRFSASITDYDTQRLVTVDSVTLRFTKPDRADIGPSRLVLSRTADGSYQGQGTNLSLEGRWSVVVTVERRRQSVEVPLQLTTLSPPQAVRTIQAPGKPPLYNVDLSGGRTLSVYLDPGKPGFNALHATLIDARGRELEIARPPVMTVSRPGVTPPAPRPLPVLQEGPGHFFSDAELGPGEWQVEVVATMRTGEVLRARLTVRL